jgi:hypothetical protein
MWRGWLRPVVKTYRSRTTFKHARANLSHLRLLAFVLRLQRHLLFAAIFVKCRASIIVEHKNSCPAKDLDTLFRKSFVAFAEIRNRAIRAVGKSQVIKTESASTILLDFALIDSAKTETGNAPSDTASGR